jgi:glycosyltransferase involved in cell wall biosynthesis
VIEAAAGLAQQGHRCWLFHGLPARDAERYAAVFTQARGCIELGATTGATAAALIAELRPAVLYLHKLGATGIAPWLGHGPRVVRMVHDHDLTCPRRHKYFLASGRACSLALGWRCWLDGAFLARERQAWLGVRWVSLGAHARELERHRAVDLLLVGSSYMREQLLLNRLSPQRIATLAPVVASHEHCSAPPPPPAAPRLLYVGQLIRGKGVDLLLEALARLELPFECELIGAGNAEPSLRRQAAALGLGERVRFMGWVDHEALVERYRWARGVVVPSRWPEPFGMVGLEAMRQARAVVAFAVGGIPDWLEDGVTGLLVKEHDVAAMAAALARLLVDDALALKLGQAGHQRVSERFDHNAYLLALTQHLTA